MLRELHLARFKAFDRDAVVPLRPFTLILGPNGAGKSTVLQAVDMLGGLVRSTIAELLETRRWRYEDLPHLRSASARVSLGATVELGGSELTWTLELGARRYPGIHAESVVARDDERELLGRSGRSMSRLDEAAQRSERIQQTLASSWLSALEPSSEDDQRRFPRLTRLAEWARGIEGHFFLDPDRLRAPGRGEQKELGAHGENLAPFLASIKKRSDGSFARVLARVQQYYPRLESATLRSANYGWTELEVTERWNGERARFNARQVSDGLLRMLAISAMQESWPRPTVLLLDEVENGMHPQLLGGLIEMLQDLSATTQVIATTHSPIAANYVRDDQSILIVDRAAGGHPRCVPLPKARNYKRLRAHFDAGELWYNLGEEKLLP